MLIGSHTLDVNSGSEQVYNALDTCLTHEIWTKLQEQKPAAEPAYSFELALQAPVLEMMLRGFRVNPVALKIGIDETKKQLARMEHVINVLSHAVMGNPLNPNSGMQLKELFYGRLGISPIKAYVKGELKFPMDRAIIEQIEDYFQARPIAACVLHYRDLSKQLSVLETEIDSDWRMRTSYNIGGTKSARFSSSKSPTGSGTNLQNITETLRHILVADPGYTLCGIDASQSDSRMVGYMCGLLFNDWTYLDACESGDLHTSVARLTWPNLGWTGDLTKDKEIAEQIFYRHFTYRDCCKKLGHGCLTEDHEVLTPSGWVPIATKPSVILQFDPVQKTSSFTPVNTWVDKMWSGPFCEWDNLSLSVKMTGSHRVYYTTTADEKLAVTSALHVPDSARIPLGEGRFTTVEQKQRTVSEETNRVFCPSVPTQAFYVRRNGKISVTGNTNFLGKAPTLSKLIHIPRNLVEPFQEKYFDGFPALQKWHAWVATELQTKKQLVSIHGRRRDFFDRIYADETLRKGLAFLAASATADNLNLGMWRLWKHMPEIQLLAQVHDAIYFQFPNELKAEDVVSKAEALLRIELCAPNGRKFAVPTEAKIGRNWGNASEKNPNGLKKFKLS